MSKKGVFRLIRVTCYIAVAVVGILLVSRVWHIEDVPVIGNAIATGSKAVEIMGGTAGEKGDTPCKKGSGYIDAEDAPLGYVYAAYLSPKHTKFSLVKEENTVHHDLVNDGIAQRFSLTAGSGRYLATIYENVTDISYKKVKALKFTADIHDPTAPYRVSNSVVHYDADMVAIQHAAELTEGLQSPREKAHGIYTWVVQNITYDYDMLGALESGYVCEVDTTFDTKKGICYDFAVLYAAMCRSQGIPCKVVSGYADAVEGYHAWNEVYFDGAYHVVDTSTEAQLDEDVFIRGDGYEAVRYD